MSSIVLNEIKQLKKNEHLLVLTDSLKGINKAGLSAEETEYAAKVLSDESKNHVKIEKLGTSVWIYMFRSQENETYVNRETWRRGGCNAYDYFAQLKVSDIQILDLQNNTEATQAFVEGFLLASYHFDKYKKEKKGNFTVNIKSAALNTTDLKRTEHIVKEVFRCKDLVNEPFSYMNTSRFGKEIRHIASESGLKVEIYDEIKIQSLKMGGLLAVNKGSSEPPFFAVLEWKPKNAVNTKPYVLVGKGITFDTGGYSIKPAIGMEEMRIDMSGGAVTACTLSLLAQQKIPVHVIGLIPVTDNMVNEKAQVPGDIITMHNGTTVEVLNTDAEGRLILADMLSYAAKYKPELVIDVATLTGSAHLALGKYCIFAAGKNCSKDMEQLKISGFNVYERLVEFPLWDEYGESIKSKVADIKNVGARHAGAIIASKFLEHFTDYPWIHLDIAGPAFFEKPWNYHSAGATGIGVRLFFDFFSRIAETELAN